MWIVWAFVVGLVVGAIARVIMPGEESMNVLQTVLLGIGGSFLGGFIADLLNVPSGWILSIIGAVIILFAVKKLKEHNVI